MKLLIISHTEHYKREDQTIVGWGPLVSELNHLVSVFDEIIHVAMLHPDNPPPSSLPYTSSKIKFVALPPLGGKTFISKLKTLVNAYRVIKIVKKQLQGVDLFQFRAPTGIGVFLIPYLTLFVKTKGWYKYAGNWNQKNPPLGYWLQREMLKKQNRKVTINGKWHLQPSHCITFENPCLTDMEYKNGELEVAKKQFSVPWSFCFVGRLERAKGVERIINAFKLLSEQEKKTIKEVIFVGNGEEETYFKQLAIKSGVNMKFTGFLPRNEVFKLYKKSHFFLLPSTASEGFPKVIAEAMNVGCLPIVSAVSSIAQYVNEINGFVLRPTTSEELYYSIKNAINEEQDKLKNKAYEGRKVSKAFTFSHYNKRIINEILNS
ncbi:MAG: glycosyltransferase [Flavobacteriales bacterium]